jgi:hypothetical protein
MPPLRIQWRLGSNATWRSVKGAEGALCELQRKPPFARRLRGTRRRVQSCGGHEDEWRRRERSGGTRCTASATRPVRPPAALLLLPACAKLNVRVRHLRSELAVGAACIIFAHSSAAPPGGSVEGRHVLRLCRVDLVENGQRAVRTPSDAVQIDQRRYGCRPPRLRWVDQLHAVEDVLDRCSRGNGCVAVAHEGAPDGGRLQEPSDAAVDATVVCGTLQGMRDAARERGGRELSCSRIGRSPAWVAVVRDGLNKRRVQIAVRSGCHGATRTRGEADAVFKRLKRLLPFTRTHR